MRKRLGRPEGHSGAGTALRAGGKQGKVKDEAVPWWEKQENGQKETEPQQRGRDPHLWPLVPPAQGLFPFPQLPLCLWGQGLTKDTTQAVPGPAEL